MYINSRQIGAATSSIKFNTTPTNDWKCNDWMFWHQELVKAFQAGAFASRIKYEKSEAIRLSNQVFLTHWQKHKSTFFDSQERCGYSSDFFNYFKSVGLTDILTYLQSIFTSTGTTVINTVDSAGQTIQNTAEAAKNSAGALKWLLPTLLVGGGVVLVVWGYNTYAKKKTGMGRLKRRRKAKKR